MSQKHVKPLKQPFFFSGLSTCTRRSTEDYSDRLASLPEIQTTSSKLEEASTHKSANTYANNVF